MSRLPKRKGRQVTPGGARSIQVYFDPEAVTYLDAAQAFIADADGCEHSISGIVKLGLRELIEKNGLRPYLKLARPKD